jgi:hypothetical protein
MVIVLALIRGVELGIDYVVIARLAVSRLSGAVRCPFRSGLTPRSEWTARWSDVVAFEIIPAVGSAEVAGRLDEL